MDVQGEPPGSYVQADWPTPQLRPLPVPYGGGILVEGDELLPQRVALGSRVRCDVHPCRVWLPVALHVDLITILKPPPLLFS